MKLFKSSAQLGNWGGKHHWGRVGGAQKLYSKKCCVNLPGQLRVQSVLLPTYISGICFCKEKIGCVNPSRTSVQELG